MLITIESGRAWGVEIYILFTLPFVDNGVVAVEHNSIHTNTNNTEQGIVGVRCGSGCTHSTDMDKYIICNMLYVIYNTARGDQDF